MTTGRRASRRLALSVAAVAAVMGSLAFDSAQATSTLDQGFGNSGIIVAAKTSALGGMPVISARPDGKILFSSGFPDVVVRRLEANGTVDATFAPLSTTPGSVSFNGATEAVFESSGGVVKRSIGSTQRFRPVFPPIPPTAR